MSSDESVCAFCRRPPMGLIGGLRTGRIHSDDDFVEIEACAQCVMEFESLDVELEDRDCAVCQDDHEEHDEDLPRLSFGPNKPQGKICDDCQQWVIDGPHDSHPPAWLADVILDPGGQGW